MAHLRPRALYKRSEYDLHSTWSISARYMFVLRAPQLSNHSLTRILPCERQFRRSVDGPRRAGGGGPERRDCRGTARGDKRTRRVLLGEWVCMSVQDVCASVSAVQSSGDTCGAIAMGAHLVCVYARAAGWVCTSACACEKRGGKRHLIQR